MTRSEIGGRPPASQPPVLRPAHTADIQPMAEVFLASWRGGYRGVVPDAIIDSLNIDSVSALLTEDADAADRTTTVLLDGADNVVGFVRYGANHEGPGGYIASLYVHPAAAGCANGRRLLRHALQAMAGVDVALWVFEANTRGRDLYERTGFRYDGTKVTDPRWQTPQVRLRRPADHR